MRRSVTEALESQADEYRIVRELHDVPPYRVFEVRVDGRRAVLKIDDHPRGRAAAEGTVQRFVAERTSVPVPDVVAVGDDHFVAEWDDDAPQETPPVDREWARAVGVWMAALHDETAGEFAAYGRPRPGADGIDLHDGGHATWIRAARARLAYHREYLDEVGHADVADDVDDFLRERPDAFDGAGSPVLCHGNVLPDHAAVEDGEAVSVIDFEHALVAPGEYDYWRLAQPLFAGPDDVDPTLPRAFREGTSRSGRSPTGSAVAGSCTGR